MKTDQERKEYLFTNPCLENIEQWDKLLPVYFAFVLGGPLSPSTFDKVGEPRRSKLLTNGSVALLNNSEGIVWG